VYFIIIYQMPKIGKQGKVRSKSQKLKNGFRLYYGNQAIREPIIYINLNLIAIVMANS
jgi:hypothetical protein